MAGTARGTRKENVPDLSELMDFEELSGKKKIKLTLITIAYCWDLRQCLISGGTGFRVL